MKHTTEVELDPMTVRLLSFIAEKGGASEVARQIGIGQPSVFNNYKHGRNKQPSPEILQKFAATYYDFDPLYILTGKRSNLTIQIPSDSPTANDAVLIAQIEGLRRENAVLKDSVNILRAVVGSQLGRDLEGSKSKSASNLTQGTFSFVQSKPVGTGRYITPSLRDAKGINQVYPNQTSKYPKY